MPDPEVAVVEMRGAAVAVLGAIAVTGAAVAGLEAALTAPRQPLSAPVPEATPTAAPQPTGAPCAPPVRVCVRLSQSTGWLLAEHGAVLGPFPVHDEGGIPVGVFLVDARHAAHTDDPTGQVREFALVLADGTLLYQADTRPPAPGSVQLPRGLGEKIFHAVSVGELIEVVP